MIYSASHSGLRQSVPCHYLKYLKTAKNNPSQFYHKNYALTKCSIKASLLLSQIKLIQNNIEFCLKSSLNMFKCCYKCLRVGINI